MRTSLSHLPERTHAGELDRRTLKGFAMHTDEQRRLFKLLADAYIHARCIKFYTITREELEYLAGRVRKLRGMDAGRNVPREPYGLGAGLSIGYY